MLYRGFAKTIITLLVVLLVCLIASVMAVATSASVDPPANTPQVQFVVAPDGKLKRKAVPGFGCQSGSGPPDAQCDGHNVSSGQMMITYSNPSQEDHIMNENASKLVPGKAGSGPPKRSSTLGGFLGTRCADLHCPEPPNS